MSRGVTYTRKARQPGTLARVGAGIIGGLAASLAMNMFGRAMNAVNGREAEGAAPGADRHGRGAQPPQAVGRAEDDAAVRTGSMAYRGLTGEEPDRDTRRRLRGAPPHSVGAATRAPY